MIKFILSDLDGVIRHFPVTRDEAIEKKYDLPHEILNKTAFDKKILQSAVTGKITDEAWRSEITKSLASLCTAETAQQAVQEWSLFAGELDERYLNLLKSTFGETPVVLLTNGTSRLNDDLRTLGIADKFFRIFNSADIGICKPDPQIFQHVIDQLNCTPQEILFIDDSRIHIEAARNFGLMCCQYMTFEIFQKTCDLYFKNARV